MLFADANHASADAGLRIKLPAQSPSENGLTPARLPEYPVRTRFIL
jgi:hypothetical protein